VVTALVLLLVYGASYLADLYVLFGVHVGMKPEEVMRMLCPLYPVVDLVKQ
jgi:hypothetical protein